MRKQSVSQWGQEGIGIAVEKSGVLTDADGPVLISIVRSSDSVTVVSGATATHDGLGEYSFELLPVVTNAQGDYIATWTFTLTGVPRMFETALHVTDPQPFWDGLNGDQKYMIEGVYYKVADGFDSTIGGPYLWELPQTTFGFETVARLGVVDAMNKINFSKPKAFQPPFQIGANVSSAFPVGWYGLWQKATFYELLKHLARSYLEQPDPVGVDTAHLDRRQYHDKWMAMANFEKEELEEQIAMLKRTFMNGVRTRAILMAGGIFPASYLNPARPRWPYVISRFY